MGVKKTKSPRGKDKSKMDAKRELLLLSETLIHKTTQEMLTTTYKVSVALIVMIKES